ncbi:hypothetical protein CR513_25152, partial [Mucuna pruriens]
MFRSGRRKYMQQVMVMQSDSGHPKDPVISFSKADYEGIQPHQDNLLVILVVVVDYKVERVLINQGSSSNKLGKTKEELEAAWAP